MSFSIIIPCYKCEKTLTRTVDSLLGQREYLSNIILIDDGSPDNSGKLAQELQAQYPNLIVFHSQSNQGPAAARNHGIKYITGDYVVFLDSDDCLTQDCLKTFSNEFERDPSLDLIIAGYRAIRPTSESIKLPEQFDSNEDLLKAFCFKEINISGGAVAMRSKVLKTSQYPTTIKHGEDLVFFSHLLSQHKAKTLPFVALDVYHHDDSLRHDSSSILDEGDKMIDILFNPEVLSVEMMKLKPAYHAQYLMYLADVAAKAGQKQLTMEYLKKIGHIKPAELFRVKTLKILIKSFF